MVRLTLADKGGAGDLRNSGDDIGDDEEPQDCFWCEDRMLAAETTNEYGEDGVDTGGEEDGRGHDEEVVEDKVYEVVGVPFRRQGTCAVADNLKNETDGKCDEPPGLVLYCLGRVDDEVHGK